MIRIIYSRHYNIGFRGMEKLHPFDIRKYGRAWALLRKRLRHRINECRVTPRRPVSREELLRVHSAEYLSSLRSSAVLARALEVPIIAKLPAWLVDWFVLRPMRWGTMGTILAAGEAMTHGLAVNLSGGYHHAKPGNGEGFSIYSDVALAVHELRREGRLGADDRVAYVDLDAHQGNGVCHQFMDDRRIFILDMYNELIYPAYDFKARARIDCDLPLEPFISGDKYLQQLRERLPMFLDGIARNAPIKLGIYNAGTDVYSGDRLGSLGLSEKDILARDLYVTQEMRSRGIPMLMVLSGGYSPVSYRLVAESVGTLFEKWSSI